MTKSEEIFIILKRIPQQAAYIEDLLDRDYIIGAIPTSHATDWYIMQQIKKRNRIWNEDNGLIPSALGVLDNLINRLNELVCQTE